MSQNQPKKKKGFFRTFAFILAIVTGIFIYAYGFHATQFNLDETSKPERQWMLVNILRELARPYLIDYEKEEIIVDKDIYIPCPESGEPSPSPVEDASKPYVIMTPTCGGQSDYIEIEGFNFFPKKQVLLSFFPESKVKINLGTATTDSQGHFLKEIQLPERESTAAQTIEIKTQRNVGLPYFTQTTKDSWDKILETIFMALLATTLGILVAVPLSFIAARNLMRDIKSPAISLIFYLILVPIGFWLAVTLVGLVGRLSSLISRVHFLDLAFLVVLAIVTYLLFKYALPKQKSVNDDTHHSYGKILVIAGITISGLLAIFCLSSSLKYLGDILQEILGPLGFLAKFIGDLGSLLRLLLFIVAAIAGIAMAMSIGGKVGQRITREMSIHSIKLITLIVSPIAFSFIFVIFGLFITWLYRIDNVWLTYYFPAIIGAVLGLLIALILRPKKIVAFGMIIYYIARTTFNTLRAIEPLIMAIIFVVWVGLGPFAGVLALALHTIASLSKLFSEQVESIQKGPLEAIRATGANGLQTIVYAVIPQIIPPYISLAMDRWDINVRMSTIIGMVGGGGIGFLLMQNVNLLRYRAVSVQIIFIAIVVATMDYISSRLRQKAI